MRRNMSLLENIFSVKNSDLNHKQICIMGLKIKWYKEAKPHYVYEDLPIENNKIVFRTLNGGYNCNPKYIAEEVMKQNLPYKLVWVVNKNILKFIDDFPRDRIQLVMSGSAEDIKETSTAKIIIDNERRTNYIQKGIFKKPEQIYIQTFHGSLGIKKTGTERNDLSKNGFRLSKIDSEQIDFLTSNSIYTTNFFKQIFFNKGNILEIGHPRNDIFFETNQSYRQKVCKKLNIPESTKIVMYAPTLREDRDMNCYTLDYEKLLSSLNDKYGGDWILIKRLHPLMLDFKYQFDSQNSKVIDVTDYDDIQELLIVSDVLVTDYSSCIYDFMLSYKPGFIFATDIKKYENCRGLYYPLTSTPFPVAENNDEFVKNIENFNYEKYKKEVKKFLDEKGCIEDGHAAKRVVKLIKTIIESPNEVGKTIEEITKR